MYLCSNQNIILEGKGEQNKLFVKNLKNNSNIKIKDKVFTSGLGGKYTKGIMIGIVEKISISDDESLLEVEIESSSDFNAGTKILLTQP